MNKYSSLLNDIATIKKDAEPKEKVELSDRFISKMESKGSHSQMEISISDKNLNQFVSLESYVSQELEYGGVQGKAQLLGWQIVFFKSMEDPDSLGAISLSDVLENEVLKDIANEILAEIQFPVRLGAPLVKIENEFGSAYSKDFLFEESTRLHFLLKEGRQLLSLVVGNQKGLWAVEVMENETIIRERLGTLKKR